MSAIAKLGPTGFIPNISNLAGPSLANILPDAAPEHQFTAIAAVALAAGDLVYITATAANSAGQPTVGLASAAGAGVATKVRGIVTKRCAAGEACTVWRGSIDVNYAPAGALTPGAELYLSGTTAGGISTSNAETVTVSIGYAITDTLIHLYAF